MVQPSGNPRNRPIRNTFVISDLHLCEAEPVQPKRPLWKRYKQRDLFVDHEIAAMLDHLQDQVDGPAELVLNGDIFDFDAVMQIPSRSQRRAENMRISWLEKRRGLAPTEPKSLYKLRVILRDHPIIVQAWKAWVQAGHHLVFTIGNHDMELHWAAVQQELTECLTTEDGRHRIRFCSWFYLSGGDTYIEHGNQYDVYCLCHEPLWPTIRPPGGKPRIRLPMAAYAVRYMINGMGVFNPHAESTFLRPFLGYVSYFYNTVAKIQPGLPFAYAFGAGATLVASLRDGMLPSERDPFHLEARVLDVAVASEATPAQVRALDALKVHAAVFRPWQVMKELWLDKTFMLLLLILGSFQVMATVHALTGVSMWWYWALVALLIPPFILWAHRDESDVRKYNQELRARLQHIARVAGVRRVIVGHSHHEEHSVVDGVELLNPGTWSPAYEDAECTIRLGRTCVVWVRPSQDGTRTAHLMEWTGDALVTMDESHMPDTQRRPDAPPHDIPQAV